MSCCRRRWAHFKEELGWFIGDAACLVLVAFLLPLVPVFKLFDELRELHEGE